MKTRTLAKLAAVVTVATASLAGFVVPAHAATTAATTTTFTLTAGALAVTAPSSASLGSAATGTGTTSALLGTVSIADGRGALLGSWTASVTSTSFTTGAATANETIANSAADYWSGAATSSTGTGTFTPGQLLVANKVTLGASRTAFSAAAVVGNNTAAWDPTVIINIPSAAVAGVYTGTITHSIA